MSYLLCYDIANPRRLQRVFKACVRAGIPYQYSVFWLQLTQEGLDRLLHQLEALIDPKEDDIRVYRLPKDQPMHGLGAGLFPEGILLIPE